MLVEIEGLGLLKGLVPPIQVPLLIFQTLAFGGTAAHLLDEHTRIDTLLDKERRGFDTEFVEIEVLFTTPDELRIEIGIARRNFFH